VLTVSAGSPPAPAFATAGYGTPASVAPAAETALAATTG
jgi:hypothetical protein